MFTGLWEEKAILQYSRDHLGQTFHSPEIARDLLLLVSKDGLKANHSSWYTYSQQIPPLPEPKLNF